jgi:hypothetical protein
MANLDLFPFVVSHFGRLRTGLVEPLAVAVLTQALNHR